MADKDGQRQPGEGKHPMSLFQDKNDEYKSYPSIYCGESMKYANDINKDNNGFRHKFVYTNLTLNTCCL